LCFFFFRQSDFSQALSPFLYRGFLPDISSKSSILFCPTFFSLSGFTPVSFPCPLLHGFFFLTPVGKASCFWFLRFPPPLFPHSLLFFPSTKLSRDPFTQNQAVPTVVYFCFSDPLVPLAAFPIPFFFPPFWLNSNAFIATPPSSAKRRLHPFCFACPSPVSGVQSEKTCVAGVISLLPPS